MLKLFKGKKGTQQMWWIIAAAIIAIIVVVFMILWFRSGGEKAYDGLSDKISGLGDYDKDGVADLFDKCPCEADIGDDWPEGKTECSTKAKDCKKEIKDSEIEE
jgi:hypothetical protein